MEQFESVFTAEESAEIAKEFTRLKDTCYLDHAGTTLYADSQIRAIGECLTSSLLCNPHTSRTTEDLLDQVRFRVLKHFNTRSSEYGLVFTSGTTASLKLVAECFDFDDGRGAFVYTRDNHTSVLGMREVVRTERVVPVGREDLSGGRFSGDGNPSLLVFPGQCNFNGFKYSLDLVEIVQREGLAGFEGDRFHVCLDAASFVSTNFLDLGKVQPSFVCLSFYKIFGFPTGLGALLVHRSAESLLKKRYYGGGTVKIAMAGRNFHVKRDELVERFEDGTVPFTSIISLLQGFETLERFVPSDSGLSTIDRVSRHTFALGKYCFKRLKGLRHANSNPVVKLYHDTGFENRELQGGIVNFNVLHEDGSFVGFAEVAYMASVHNVVLRTGCFCNPGSCQRLLELSDEDVLKQFNAGHVCGDANDLIGGQPTGSVRVSFGYMSRPEDVDRLVEMIEKCYIKKLVNGLTRKQIVSNYKNYDQPKLKMICLFPIKSCGAYKIATSWPLCQKGLKHDREFVIVDENGVAMTQKKLVEMCLIKPKIDLKTNELILTHPNMENFTLSLDLQCSESQSIKLCQTKVCQDNVQAIDCGDEVANWISIALQTSGLRLLKQSDDEARTLKKSTKEIALSNQAQFLLINQASVRWLADMVPDWDDLPEQPSLDSLVDRFRGNLIIDSVSPLEEANWTQLRIGPLQFSVDGPCSRCQMICIDQSSGTKSSEPLRTIAREFKGKMRFGIYLSHVNSLESSDEKMLHCGSPLQVFAQ